VSEEQPNKRQAKTKNINQPTKPAQGPTALQAKQDKETSQGTTDHREKAAMQA
jgi:hypothetical protein